jgi:hypothetical protein
MQSIEGIYRNGKVELLQPGPHVREARVVVTFLSDQGRVDLEGRGIDPAQARDLRARLSTFREDWDRSEMDVYDELEDRDGKTAH